MHDEKRFYTKRLANLPSSYPLDDLQLKLLLAYGEKLEKGNLENKKQMKTKPKR